MELSETVEELRGTYTQTLAQLGVNPLAVREVTAEESDGEDDDYDGHGGDRQGRVRVWVGPRGVERMRRVSAFTAPDSTSFRALVVFFVVQLSVPGTRQCGLLHHPRQRLHGADGGHSHVQAGATPGASAPRAP